jgi:uncharacterized protein (TIGR02118 family)
MLSPMIVVVMLLRRRADLSPAEFHTYWREKHGPLAVSLREELGIRRYVQLHAADSAVVRAMAQQRNCEEGDFDGIALLWMDDEQAMRAVGDTEAGLAAANALLEDERNFLDLARCQLFVSDAVTMID